MVSSLRLRVFMSLRLRGDNGPPMEMRPFNILTPKTLVHERYRIVRLMGQGGMGAVYEATDLRLKISVALKQTLVTGAQFRKAFQREALLLASLRHAALPVVTDYFAEGDEQFLVMQFIPGPDLATQLAKRGQPFPVDQVLGWADQLLKVLAYLHRQQPAVIHDLGIHSFQRHSQNPDRVLTDQRPL